MNVQKSFYFKNFDDNIKNFKTILDFIISGLFHLISDETAKLSHKHISMDARYLGLKPFTLTFITSQHPKILFF